MEFMELALRPGERLVMSGMASKWQTVGNKGGKLYLTNQRLVFKAHALNFGSKVDEYNLTEILTNGTTPQINVSSSLVSYNLTLYTKQGESLSFIVTRGQKDEWVQNITAAVSAVYRTDVSSSGAMNPAMVMPNKPSRLKVLQCGGCQNWMMISAGTIVQCDCGSSIYG